MEARYSSEIKVKQKKPKNHISRINRTLLIKPSKKERLAAEDARKNRYAEFKHRMNVCYSKWIMRALDE